MDFTGGNHTKYYTNPITGQRYQSKNGFIQYAKTSGDCGDGYYDPPRNERPPPPSGQSGESITTPVREPSPFDEE